MNKKKRNTVIAVVAIALVLAASAAAGVNYIGLDNLMAMIGSLSVSESESEPSGSSGSSNTQSKITMTDPLSEDSVSYTHLASGALTSFMDRAFYAGAKELYALKPAAAVVSARRAGTTAAFEQINKYFTISEMPVISSCYWNMVHGSKPVSYTHLDVYKRQRRSLASAAGTRCSAFVCLTRFRSNRAGRWQASACCRLSPNFCRKMCIRDRPCFGRTGWAYGAGSIGP